MAKVILFGIKDFAELARFYLENDSSHSVEAFCVDGAFAPPERKLNGLPILLFEDVELTHSPEEFSFFAPISARNMNRDREQVFRKIKTKGYKMISYISSKATIFHDQIGENCFILEGNNIQPFTKIGNNVTLWSGNHVGHHSIINDHVMLTSHVVISGRCEVGSFSYFGVNSSVRDGIKIGEGTFISMGAAINRSTDPWSVYKGQPAEKMSIPSDRLRF